MDFISSDRTGPHVLSCWKILVIILSVACWSVTQTIDMMVHQSPHPSCKIQVNCQVGMSEMLAPIVQKWKRRSTKSMFGTKNWTRDSSFIHFRLFGWKINKKYKFYFPPTQGKKNFSIQSWRLKFPHPSWAASLFPFKRFTRHSLLTTETREEDPSNNVMSCLNCEIWVPRWPPYSLKRVIYWWSFMGPIIDWSHILNNMDGDNIRQQRVVRVCSTCSL